MDFSIERFERFCSKLKIDSKEMGRIPLNLLGGQRYVIREIAAGLKQGVHEFVILKGRQMGISTVGGYLLAIETPWITGFIGYRY